MVNPNKRSLSPRAHAMRQQMLDGLIAQFGPLDSDEERFDVEGAIWWFANDNYTGMADPLYEILSTSEFMPSPQHDSVDDENERTVEMYWALYEILGMKSPADAIVKAVDAEIERQANISAAEAWSTPSEDILRKYGRDVWIVAEFDGYFAVLGDAIPEEENVPDPPPRYRRIPEAGGRISTTEIHVDMQHVLKKVAKALAIDVRRVEAALASAGRSFKDEEPVYVSGRTEVWARGSHV